MYSLFFTIQKIFEFNFASILIIYSTKPFSLSRVKYITTRDVAAAQEVRNQGINAVGQDHRIRKSLIVSEKVCGLEATESIGHGILVSTG